MKPICKATSSDKKTKKSDKINQKKIIKPTRKSKKMKKKEQTKDDQAISRGICYRDIRVFHIQALNSNKQPELNDNHLSISEELGEGIRKSGSEKGAHDDRPNRPPAAGCPPPPQDRDTRRDKVSAGQAGQVGLPEGKPDRCNMDRCPVDPVEGDIPR